MRILIPDEIWAVPACAMIPQMVNDRPMTTSVLVAKKFHKEHKHVLEAIRKIVTTAENSAVLQKCKSRNINPNGRSLPPNRHLFYRLERGRLR